MAVSDSEMAMALTRGEGQALAERWLSESAVARDADRMMGLSRERIADELLKLLALPDPVPTLTSGLSARGSGPAVGPPLRWL